MKTSRTLKNGGFADVAGQHGMSPRWISQIRILLYQCFHIVDMP